MPGCRARETKIKHRFREHCEIGKALYSVPSDYIGAQVDARADSQLVKLFHRGQLIKTHRRQRPGGRHTDPDDLPPERVGYAMRDLERLQRNADKHGQHIGIYVFRLLDDQLPWTRMRAVYRLLNLVRRYDAASVDAACRTALELDVVSVTKIAAMLAKALETTPPELPAAAGHPAGRFEEPGTFRTGGVWFLTRRVAPRTIPTRPRWGFCTPRLSGA